VDNKDKPNQDRPYAVGYGKPPLATRFQKGHPGYKRRKAPNTAAIDFRLEVIRQLDQMVTVTENGKSRRMTVAEVLSRRFQQTIANGDAKARRQLMGIYRWSDRQSDSSSAAGARERKSFETIMWQFAAAFHEECYQLICDSQRDCSTIEEWEEALKGGDLALRQDLQLFALYSDRAHFEGFLDRLAKGVLLRMSDRAAGTAT
jgi:hypothetical protein